MYEITNDIIKFQKKVMNVERLSVRFILIHSQ